MADGSWRNTQAGTDNAMNSATPEIGAFNILRIKISAQMSAMIEKIQTALTTESTRLKVASIPPGGLPRASAASVELFMLCCPAATAVSLLEDCPGALQRPDSIPSDVKPPRLQSPLSQSRAGLAPAARIAAMYSCMICLPG